MWWYFSSRGTATVDPCVNPTEGGFSILCLIHSMGHCRSQLYFWTVSLHIQSSRENLAHEPGLWPPPQLILKLVLHSYGYSSLAGRGDGQMTLISAMNLFVEIHATLTSTSGLENYRSVGCFPSRSGSSTWRLSVQLQIPQWTFTHLDASRTKSLLQTPNSVWARTISATAHFVRVGRSWSACPN